MSAMKGPVCKMCLVGMPDEQPKTPCGMEGKPLGKLSSAKSEIGFVEDDVAQCLALVAGAWSIRLGKCT